MRVYVDTSALLKRAIQEDESDPLERALERHVDDGDAIVTSSLAGLELGRALLRVTEGLAVQDGVDDALAGVAERHLTEDIVGLARRVRPSVLRSLDAIHLATAFVLDVELMITYDHRLADACRYNALRVAAPGGPTR
ncbi:type II toxin-antitoxin system VapC family toxin [Jiangella sp. DSM 45060]|uniref:type II toxin-antitoxin system VapC family toxin n=1 Tax=Jiangella sp. DSM 45060 TaxID=1798224 RepID=UPI00087D7F19|nr:type II toxin-antitoxin system VapC family toxin [Jiangella sp. DSM 45060]SDT44313.1 Predicted nucleic acid-binding protein, contains PIN domain [Jiangella sp. DSM 45060]